MNKGSQSVLVLGLNLFLSVLAGAQAGPKQYILYVGTYTWAKKPPSLVSGLLS